MSYCGFDRSSSSRLNCNKKQNMSLFCHWFHRSSYMFNPPIILIYESLMQCINETRWMVGMITPVGLVMAKKWFSHFFHKLVSHLEKIDVHLSLWNESPLTCFSCFTFISSSIFWNLVLLYRSFLEIFFGQIIKRPVRGRLFVFAKFLSLPHYVLLWIAPSLCKLFFSFLAHIYLRHGKIFPHGETWLATFIKVTWPKTIFFKFICQTPSSY